MPDIAALYGHPHCTGHRSSLAGGLYNGCLAASDVITFHFSSPLTRIISWSPRPTFEITPRKSKGGGEPYVVEADVLLACDGIKSPTRQQMLRELGADADVEGTGQAAYRIMLTREQMGDDAELLALLESDTVVRWIGEKRHLIAYAVSSHSVYNISTTQPDVHFAAATNATYTTRGSKDVMLGVFADFCPTVHKLLSLVPEGEVCEWKLQVHKPLPTWTRGAVALVGDACHPTLPHLSQGAAMAVEDGAVLAEVLSLAADTGPETLARCLKVYELLRRDRTYALVDLAAFSGRTLHLGEGAAREERDRQFADASKSGRVPDKWASPDVQRMIYSYDCVQEAREKFGELFASLEDVARGGAEVDSAPSNGHAVEQEQTKVGSIQSDAKLNGDAHKNESKEAAKKEEEKAVVAGEALSMLD
jgi:salicylate hydroxylase